MSYIATFYTHFGAMNFRRKMKALGDDKAEMMPVPRALSSSCGTCVHFFMEVDPKEVAEEEWFGCNPGVNTAHLKMKTQDLLKKFLPHIHHKATVIEL